MDIILEEWRPVVGYEGFYEVSNLGNVKSLYREVACADGIKRSFRSRQLKTPANGNGYQSVCFRRLGVQTTKEVHILVAEAFLGPRPSVTEGRSELRHLDGDKLNNKLDNLRWGTAKENSADAIAHGTKTKGVAHPRAKLSEEQVLKIYSSTGTHSEVAEKFNVSPLTVASIRNGYNWKWLTSRK